MKSVTFSIRVPEDVRNRLEKAAEEIGLSSNDIAKHAVSSAVEELERLNYEIPWPPKFRIVRRKGQPFSDEEIASLVKALEESSRNAPENPSAPYKEFTDKLHRTQPPIVIPQTPADLANQAADAAARAALNDAPKPPPTGAAAAPEPAKPPPVNYRKPKGGTPPKTPPRDDP